MVRRRNLSTASNQERAEGPGAAREDRDPATTLQAMAGQYSLESYLRNSGGKANTKIHFWIFELSPF